MQIVIGADHGGFDLKEIIKNYLAELGYSVKDYGTNSKDAVDWPDFALLVADGVSRGEYDYGIMIDGSGVASSIVCNKLPNVRAVACNDVFAAYSGREHNNANVLTMGAGIVAAAKAKMIIKTWFDTPYAGGRHQKRLDKVRSIEQRFLK